MPCFLVLHTHFLCSFCMYIHKFSNYCLTYLPKSVYKILLNFFEKSLRSWWIFVQIKSHPPPLSVKNSPIESCASNIVHCLKGTKMTSLHVTLTTKVAHCLAKQCHHISLVMKRLVLSVVSMAHLCIRPCHYHRVSLCMARCGIQNITMGNAVTFLSCVHRG